MLTSTGSSATSVDLEALPEKYLLWTDWESRNIALPEDWSQEEVDAFAPKMLSSASQQKGCARIAGGPLRCPPSNGAPSLYRISAATERGRVNIVADLRHQYVVTRNQVFIGDTPCDRRARHLLLQAIKYPDPLLQRLRSGDGTTWGRRVGDGFGGVVHSIV